MNDKDLYDDELFYDDKPHYDIPLYGDDEPDEDEPYEDEPDEDEPDNRLKDEAEFSTMAAALYDGGWRAEDRDDLKAEYDLTDEEADKICEYLKSYDEEEQREAEEFFRGGWRSKDIDRFKALYKEMDDVHVDKIFERIKKLENAEQDEQRKNHLKRKSAYEER